MRRFGVLGLGIGLLVAAVLASAGPLGAQSKSTISGTVTRAADTVDGVVIDVFAGTADGDRKTWLGSMTSGEDGAGRYRFDTGQFGHDGPCWVLTFSAPPGSRFGNNLPWLNRTVCPGTGESVVGVDADLLDSEFGGAFIGKVLDGGGPVNGVPVDLFTALADGSRGNYLATFITRSGGDFVLRANPGCYVLSYTAPEQRSFEKSGGRWLNQSACLAADQPSLRLPTVTVDG